MERDALILCYQSEQIHSVVATNRELIKDSNGHIVRTGNFVVKITDSREIVSNSELYSLIEVK